MRSRGAARGHRTFACLAAPEAATLAQPSARRFHVAPMQAFTNDHLRHFFRLLSRRAVLWTELEKCDDLLASETAAQRRLSCATSGAVTLQLGGSVPASLSRAVKLASRLGSFGEHNLNCGCPSIEAGGADFGAALMLQPALVARCVAALADAAAEPVSIKCRVAAHASLLQDGAIPADSYERLRDFVGTVAATGALSHVVLHARAAVLSGLSPAKNRQVPPLRYDYAVRLAADFPSLRITLNGGVHSMEELRLHLAAPGLDGVMVGRWLLRRPLDLRDIDSEVLSGDGVSKVDALWQHADYATAALSRPGPRELAPVLSELLCPFLLVTAQLQDDWGNQGGPDDDLVLLTAAACNAAARVLALATHGSCSLPAVTAGDAGPGPLRKLDRAIAAACGKKVHAKLLRSRKEA
jgi:tRNA-dihydrouridine synthase A